MVTYSIEIYAAYISMLILIRTVAHHIKLFNGFSQKGDKWSSMLVLKCSSLSLYFMPGLFWLVSKGLYS